MNKEEELVKKARKILTEKESQLLGLLNYLITHENRYMAWRNNQIWICFTLEQWATKLKVSEMTVRRTIKSLKEKNLICCEYLSQNKRNRTLYYRIDYQNLNDFVNAFSVKKTSLSVHQSCSNEHIPSDQNEHMYIDNIYKSSKSVKYIEIENSEHQEPKEKPTTVQDMIRIFHEELPKVNISLSKQLCRYLVAAFKTKFNSCLEAWRRYLKLLKTSKFLISEKFKLTISWIIKFVTIDRLRAGELGVNELEIPVSLPERTQEAQEHADSVNETENCKSFRRKIIEILSPNVYMSWFTKVEIIENSGIFQLKTDNDFLRDYINSQFAYRLGIDAV